MKVDLLIVSHLKLFLKKWTKILKHKQAGD